MGDSRKKVHCNTNWTHRKCEIDQCSPFKQSYTYDFLAIFKYNNVVEAELNDYLFTFVTALYGERRDKNIPTSFFLLLTSAAHSG